MRDFHQPIVNAFSKQVVKRKSFCNFGFIFAKRVYFFFLDSEKSFHGAYQVGLEFIEVNIEGSVKPVEDSKISSS